MMLDLTSLDDTTPPDADARLRSIMERFTLTAFWSTVVSLARRLVRSPVLCSSKNAIS